MSDTPPATEYGDSTTFGASSLRADDVGTHEHAQHRLSTAHRIFATSKSQCPLKTTIDSDDVQSTTIQTLTNELQALRTRVESLETENKTLKRQVKAQSERIDGLEDRVDKNDQTRKDLAKNATQAKSDVEQIKEIARSASAKACQVEATLKGDTAGNGTDGTLQLPGDVEPSTSPLDFFANCCQYKVKKRRRCA